MLLVWLVAGLIHYGRAENLYSTVEAHGPLARQALDIYRHSGTLHATHSSVNVHEVTAAPTVVRASMLVSPAPTIAPIDVVHHVPSAVDVPVTNFVAQPGYIQKVVNVPKPDIATAKLEVRRPAIQKQFYDIEHRTVVRPVGSAVVELEHPVAQKYLTPFIDSSGKSHTIAKFHRPLVYPVFSYPFYSPQYVPGQAAQYIPGQVPQFIPGQGYPSPFIPIQTPFRPFQPPQQTPVAPQQPQRPSVPARPPQQAPQPSFPSPDDVGTNSEFDPSDTVVVDNPDFTKSRNTTESSDNGRDIEDTFVEFEKEVNGETQDFNTNEKEDSDAIQHILDEFEKRQTLRKLLRQNDFQPIDLGKLNQFTPQSDNSQTHKQNPKLKSSEPSQSEPQPRPENFQVLEHSEPDFNLKVITNTDENNTNKQQQEQLPNGDFLEHSEPDFTFKIVPVSDNFEKEVIDEEHDLEEIQKILEHSETDFSFKIGVNPENKPKSSSILQPEAHHESSSTPKLEIDRESPQRSPFDSENNNDIITANLDAVPSFRQLSAEELQENQQKLIKLLTGQGLISEIALSRSGIKFDPVGDLGVVRGKVVSVTATPEKLQAGERVSTRRVVVSRPGHTIEEVDVHHPVTRLQSVTVHEPTLVQTAHTHIARVSTTLPILSRALAYH